MEGRGGRRKKASIDSHFQEVKALLPGVSRFRISQATDVDGGGGGRLQVSLTSAAAETPGDFCCGRRGCSPAELEQRGDPR